MLDIKIFVAHTQENSITVENPLYQNIITQSTGETKFIRDSEGNNISNKYDKYQYLTVQYWAWKNAEADYYGLGMENKYLSFSKSNIRNNAKTDFVYPALYFDEHPTIDPPIKFEYLNKQVIEKLNLFEQPMRELIEQHDMIITSPVEWDIAVMDQFEIPSIFDNKLEAVLNIIKVTSPEMALIAEEYLKGRIYYPGSLYIMKKELFHEYCNWSFKILEELENQTDFSNYSVEGLKMLYYVSERLLGIYYSYIKQQGKYRLAELDWCEVEHVAVEEEVMPAFADTSDCIVLTTDDRFIIGAAATLISLVKTSNVNNNYDIIIFHKDLSEKSKTLLRNVVVQRINFSLRFYDVGYEMSTYNVYKPGNNWQPCVYFKLLIPSIMHNYKKSLHLDCDLIILEDIANLLSIDLKGNAVAGCVDKGTITTSIRRTWANKYYHEKLRITNIVEYFNCGVTVFNINEVHKITSSVELLHEAEKKYLTVEQDILSKSFMNHIYILPQSWNLTIDFLGTVMNLYKQYLPSNIYQEYLDARQKPKIIHYVSALKPWDNPNLEYASYWWDTIRGTEIYEMAINSQIQKSCSENIKKTTKKFMDTL